MSLSTLFHLCITVIVLWCSYISHCIWSSVIPATNTNRQEQGKGRVSRRGAETTPNSAGFRLPPHAARDFPPPFPPAPRSPWVAALPRWHGRPTDKKRDGGAKGRRPPYNPSVVKAQSTLTPFASRSPCSPVPPRRRDSPSTSGTRAGSASLSVP